MTEGQSSPRDKSYKTAPDIQALAPRIGPKTDAKRGLGVAWVSLSSSVQRAFVQETLRKGTGGRKLGDRGIKRRIN